MELPAASAHLLRACHNGARLAPVCTTEEGWASSPTQPLPPHAVICNYLPLSIYCRLASAFTVMSIPTLVMLGPAGGGASAAGSSAGERVLTRHGRAAVMRDPAGEGFPWEGARPGLLEGCVGTHARAMLDLCSVMLGPRWLSRCARGLAVLRGGRALLQQLLLLQLGAGINLRRLLLRLCAAQAPPESPSPAAAAPSSLEVHPVGSGALARLM